MDVACRLRVVWVMTNGAMQPTPCIRVAEHGQFFTHFPEAADEPFSYAALPATSVLEGVSHFLLANQRLKVENASHATPA